MGVSYKGSISFGLIYIPITLQLTADESSVGFNMLHNKCKHRINYKKICPVCNEEVKQGDIVKGFEYQENKYIVMEDEDFEKIKSSKDKSITITQFVSLNEIDPIYYEKSYYVVPEGGERAYALLKEAMQAENKVGIAKSVLSTKESLLALRVHQDKMLISTMFFESELRSAPSVPVSIELNQNEVSLAKQLIQSMASPFAPEMYHNEYQEKLKQAITAKINGQEYATPKEEGQNNVINLMEALQASLKNQNQQRV